MTAEKLNIVVICGGQSGEHEVSLVSGCSVAKALDPKRFNVYIVGIDPDGMWEKLDHEKILSGSLLPENITFSGKDRLTPKAFPSENFFHEWDLKFDVIFPVLHGPYGEDGTVQGLFEMAHVPYVGSGVLGSSVGMDKEVSRKLLSEAEIPCVPTLYFQMSKDLSIAKCAEKCFEAFGYPYFVKPANMGSSVGVHKVKTLEDVQGAFEDAFSYDNKILVEKGLHVRELELAVLDGDPLTVSGVGEIVPRHEFYSYEAKYKDENGADLILPAVLSAQEVEKLQSLALKAFRSLQLSGLARVDFFMDKDSGEIYLNEANTMPGFTKISMYPKLMEAAGVPYRELVGRLVDLALERHRYKAQLKTKFDGAR
ncbi:MAG TPA: D-alanine--D-alanine ligase A [Bdellovibrionales bacterium]|nr:D-alanine--D-alanine ligase A [Pseudobdellovibrionaceae bacterium]HAG91317.1 D-alanine--D-alanine ligase A [Bdellovibrionales bacterium]|tara:strand:+ start:5656 stop:6759 length:1104 start_codon:yes stop_codon:yes gene_type:complete